MVQWFNTYGNMELCVYRSGLEHVSADRNNVTAGQRFPYALYLTAKSLRLDLNLTIPTTSISCILGDCNNISCNIGRNVRYIQVTDNL